MAKVNKTALHDFQTGEYVQDQHLDQNFEVLRVALNDTDDRVTNLQAQVNQNTTGITTKADKTYVDQQDAALQAQITANRINIDTHTAEIQSLNSTITGLQNITADKVDKTYVDSQDANLQTEIDALEGRVTQVETVKADKTYVDQQIANVQAGQIGDHTIDTDKLVDGAVTTPKLADGAVTANKVDGTTVLTATQINALIAEVPVNKAGDTMTGLLTIDGSGVWPKIDSKNADAPSSEYPDGLSMMTVGNTQTGWPSGTSSVLTYVGDRGGGQRIWQLIVSKVLGGIWFRTRNNDDTAWEPFYQVWHSGNGGSGSGLDADTVDGIHASTFGRKDQANTWTQRQTFAGGITDGDSNTDVSLINSVQHQVHTRSTVLTYSGGRLTKVEEKNGSTVVKTTTLNYDGNGRLSSVVETAGAVTRTSTLNYDANGNLTSVTRA